MTSLTVAGQIAGVIQSTVQVGPAWDALNVLTKMRLLDGWADAIKSHPEEAVDRIVFDLLAEPSLGDAWFGVARISRRR